MAKTRAFVLVTAIAVAVGLVGAPAATAVAAYGVGVTVLTQAGNPLGDQVVDLLVGGEGGAFIAEARSADDGTASFPDVPEGEYTVAVMSSSAAHEVFRTDVSVAGGPVQVSITEAHLNAITGTLRDAVTGAPLVGWASIDDGTGDGYVAVTSGSDGRFTLVARAGTYRQWYSAYRYLELEPAARRVVTDGVDVTGVDLRLYAESRLSGKVTLAGKGRSVGVEGAKVSITTSSTGRYDEIIQPGTITPFVRGGEATGYFTTYLGNTVRKPDAARLTVAKGHSATANIALVASARISGTVVDRKGHAAAYAAVEARNLDRPGSSSTTADAKGRYTFYGLATGKVAIMASGGTDRLPATASRTVSAVQGKPLTSVKLTLSNDAILYGQVKVSGSKVTKQDVTLLDSHGEWFGTFRPDSHGWVGFAALPAGTYYVHVDGSNLRRRVTVKAHKQVSFGTISRGKQVTVKGVVKTAAGKPAKSALVTVADRYGMIYAKVRTNSHGAYAVTAAVSGSYTVKVTPTSAADALALVRVTVTKGKARTVNVRLAKGATITGVVLNAKGKPAIGVRVETPDGRRARTSSSGACTLTGVRAGATRIWVSDPTYVGGYRDASTTATAKAGKTVRAKTATVH